MSSLIKTAQSIIGGSNNSKFENKIKLVKRPTLTLAKGNDSVNGINNRTSFKDHSNMNMNNESKEKDETLITKDSFIKKLQGRDEVDIINEANKIMRERTKNHGASIGGKTKSKLDYLGDTKEICLKNYLIDLLKEKRTDINDKELTITKALRESEKRLEKDYKDFMTFVEEMKNKQKDHEAVIKNN
jgi:hypothetical protein